MAYNTNPFLERMSERTTSDLDFVRLFSPKILEKLSEEAFEGGVHVFRSAPGAGKTTLLRAFTPTALRGFWQARRQEEMHESFQKLVERGVLDDFNRPQFLGILLSCASGYADLPPGADLNQSGLFRALLDCRIVLRTLRNLAVLLDLASEQDLSSVHLDYSEMTSKLRGIPAAENAFLLLCWAELHEQKVYAQLDAFVGDSSPEMPSHLQFEGVLWLDGIKFILNGNAVANKRLLMIDDLHKLRRKQRTLLIDELAIQRNRVPVWLAERTVSLGDELLSQGARRGRDVNEYTLEEMWTGPKGSHQFSLFAKSILDRRMLMQELVASKSFPHYLREELISSEIKEEIQNGIDAFKKDTNKISDAIRYSTWLTRANEVSHEGDLDALIELYVIRILVAREESKRQMSFDLELSTDDFESRDVSALRSAVEIIIHEELGIPYYFGLDKLFTMATANVEELLSLAAALFVGMQNKQIIRKPDLTLTPREQEKLLTEAAKRKWEFIPKNHTEGLRAQRLLDSMGAFCREKTFAPTAPYAPGVTGVRLSQLELHRLKSGLSGLGEKAAILVRVLSECSAENLLVAKPSGASVSREAGTIFYLNRTLCALYGLPLQQGGWQSVTCMQLYEWMERGPKGFQRKLTNIN
jgi:PAS domain-containing protein